MVSFADSPFKFLLLPPSPFFRSLKVRIAYNASKAASVAAERRALLVFPARNSIWDHFAGRFVNTRSYYCLSKRSRHFIAQQVITFHTFWDSISLHRKNTLKCILLYFSKLEFPRRRHTFPVPLQRVFILFRWNLASMLPDSVAKKRCRGIVIFGLLREKWVFKQR